MEEKEHLQEPTAMVESDPGHADTKNIKNSNSSPEQTKDWQELGNENTRLCREEQLRQQFLGHHQQTYFR